MVYLTSYVKTFGSGGIDNGLALNASRRLRSVWSVTDAGEVAPDAPCITEGVRVAVRPTFRIPSRSIWTERLKVQCFVLVCSLDIAKHAPEFHSWFWTVCPKFGK